MMHNKKISIFFLDISALSLFLVLCFEVWVCSFAQEDKSSGVNVSGDTVEYSESKEITATGNVKIDYKGTRLTSEKLVVNTQTKDVKTEGPTKVEDEEGIIEGSQITYNFNTKTGTILDAKFRANPYFGKAKKMDKVSDKEFVGYNGYATTCAMDFPHYRIKSKRINLFPGDKIQTRHDIAYAGNLPVAYLPWYNHSLKDPLMHVQFTPGKTKDWGPFLLSAWRYNITDNLSGRIYFDYRSKLGMAEGFGANFHTDSFGKGDFKYYYTQERAHEIEEGKPAEFQRFLIRFRHKWDITDRTNLTTEYFKITDSRRMIAGTEFNILKDYYPREYEKNSQPLSYNTLHHNFKYSSLDIMLQKRVNRWYSQIEKLPEIKYSLPSLHIAGTPLYFDNSNSAGSYNKKNAVPADATTDVDLVRFDTTNKVSLPMKVAFFSVTPFVSNRETFYNKDIYGSAIHPRTIFYTGADVSTKFYRLFDVKSNFLGMDINGLRHIITPTIDYDYNHEPTIQSGKLRQIDSSIDSISRLNAAILELTNLLQTKRGKGKKKATVDLAEFKVTTTYTFKPKGGRGSNLSDFLYKLKLLPYSWMRVDADLTYNHFEDYVSNANYDINFDIGKERSFGFGQRYVNSPSGKVNNEYTYNLKWRLSPKWKVSLYQRIRSGHKSSSYKTGLREQEYIISRDLHCWELDFTYNVKAGEGESIWLIFRLKAFPEIEFNFNKSYHAPKPGSQSNP